MFNKPECATIYRIILCTWSCETIPLGCPQAASIDTLDGCDIPSMSSDGKVKFDNLAEKAFSVIYRQVSV